MITTNRKCPVQFNNWMANVVKSIHYSDNNKMVCAFERLRKRNPNLRNYNHVFTLNQY